MIYYKIDILSELKKHGYNLTRIRQENIISQATLQNIRQNKPINFNTLNTVCEILNRQPGQVIGYKPDDAPADGEQ